MILLLEALNGAAILPAAVLVILLTQYFRKESLRRGLNAMDWLHLPPSMNLALAMFVLIVGLTFRLGATWLWYMIGLKLVPIEMLFLVAILVIITGLLCTIRALTEPDFGRRPWIFMMAATGMVALVLLSLS